jgi:hypothetical protein
MPGPQLTVWYSWELKSFIGSYVHIYGEKKIGLLCSVLGGY